MINIRCNKGENADVSLIDESLLMQENERRDE